jgi:SAM-dependent methyltransferase
VSEPAAPISDRLEYQRGRYNRVYGGERPRVYNPAPSEFLLESLRALRKDGGRGPAPVAIDMGAGQGRNSIAMAAAGYDVTAIDISGVGLAHLRAEAEQRGLPIHTLEADVFSVRFEPGGSDLVIAVYFAVSDALAARMRDATGPGGAVLIEAQGDAAEPDGLPLPRRFEGWDILRYEKADDFPDWFWRGPPERTAIVRFLARKPIR